MQRQYVSTFIQRDDGKRGCWRRKKHGCICLQSYLQAADLTRKHNSVSFYSNVSGLLLSGLASWDWPASKLWWSSSANINPLLLSIPPGMELTHAQPCSWNNKLYILQFVGSKTLKKISKYRIYNVNDRTASERNDPDGCFLFRSIV